MQGYNDLDSMLEDEDSDDGGGEATGSGSPTCSKLRCGVLALGRLDLELGLREEEQLRFREVRHKKKKKETSCGSSCQADGSWKGRG